MTAPLPYLAALSREIRSTENHAIRAVYRSQTRKAAIFHALEYEARERMPALHAQFNNLCA